MGDGRHAGEAFDRVLLLAELTTLAKEACALMERAEGLGARFEASDLDQLTALGEPETLGQLHLASLSTIGTMAVLGDLRSKGQAFGVARWGADAWGGRELDALRGIRHEKALEGCGCAICGGRHLLLSALEAAVRAGKGVVTLGRT